MILQQFALAAEYLENMARELRTKPVNVELPPGTPNLTTIDMKLAAMIPEKANWNWNIEIRHYGSTPRIAFECWTGEKNITGRTAQEMIDNVHKHYNPQTTPMPPSEAGRIAEASAILDASTEQADPPTKPSEESTLDAQADPFATPELAHAHSE